MADSVSDSGSAGHDHFGEIASVGFDAGECKELAQFMAGR